MDIVGILRIGAIGLAFLLALFAFRLIAQRKTEPVLAYTFMAFCLMLVLIGALLQHLDSQANKGWENALAEKANLQNEKAAIVAAMAKIVETLSGASEPLLQVTTHVTDGQVCNGRGSGIPLPNANIDANRIADALSRIAAASEVAKQNQH